MARLLQANIVVLLLAALAWLTRYWTRSPPLAVAGAVAIAMAYSVFLALELVALRTIGSRDPAPPPGCVDLLRAWAKEAIFAPMVFGWRQPFRWRQVPDRLECGSPGSPRRGAVFIHGFACNRGFWTPWLKRMQQLDRPFIAVNLEPVFGAIDLYAPIIDDAVRRMTAATGLPPVLVCHSMGGLAARAWLTSRSAYQRVDHVITIGAPHRGTWLARFSRLTNGRQMQIDSAWLLALAQAEGAQAHGRFICWYSNCDNVVFPVSTATLPGADNRFVPGMAHVDLAFDAKVIEESLGLIAR
jgi:pimeloyl-ACP methyl ester carboxylesterase